MVVVATGGRLTQGELRISRELIAKEEAEHKSQEGEAAKKTPQVLGSVCVISLAGFWLERNALVWPALSPLDDSVWHGGIQLGIGLGFLGAFVLLQMLVHRVFPTHPLPRHD